MKKIVLFLAFSLSIFYSYSQATEIHTKFSKIFKSAIQMDRDTYEKKADDLLHGQTFCALVDNYDFYVVSRYENVWCEVHRKLHDPDNYEFTKLFLQCDTMEHIEFYPTGKIIKYTQKQFDTLYTYIYCPNFDLKEYIKKNLYGFTW